MWAWRDMAKMPMGHIVVVSWGKQDPCTTHVPAVFLGGALAVGKQCGGRLRSAPGYSTYLSREYTNLDAYLTNYPLA